ncbi:hypothetical protein B296_00013178 [Ensete ventricosum]|uniref:Uncharacterized protein n=1 Tax=Ensete ventricosum TaxID=4639 RepID=A0A426Z8H2_ENSVE|nr:hypothetical protein B296_00013178 [Ensete ventricosum]
MIQYKRSNSANDSSIIADLTEIPTLKGSHAAASNGDKSAAHLLSCVDCCTVRRPQQLKTTVTGGMFRASNLAVEGDSCKFSVSTASLSGTSTSLMDSTPDLFFFS